MKLELKPKFDEEIKELGFEATHSGVSEDGKISWAFDNQFLQVRDAHTREILTSWRCGKASGDDQVSIVCVTALPFKETHMLLVATETLAEEGTLCLFNLKLKKVIRSIELPQKISALEVVFADPDEDPPTFVISQHLLFFSGLVAVGTQGGYTYLVDLCLDELNFYHFSETDVKKCSVVSPRLVNLAIKKDESRTSGTHLALLLDEQCHRQGQFYYRRQDDTVQKIMEEETIAVTCLKYMRHAGQLVIGFNFGAFQMWKIYNPVMDYATNYRESLPVTRLIASEPENDPRSLLYLWVGHDTVEDERYPVSENCDSVAYISLYQLSFRNKETHSSFGVYYDELESVCARLDHHLTTDPYTNDFKSTFHSRILSCFTIAHPYYRPAEHLADSIDEGHQGIDLSLSVVVWKAENRQQNQTKHWMCVFDLNRWYHAQMPHAVRCHGNPLQVCSFWAVYNLDDVAEALAPHGLLGVEVQGDNVLRLINNSPLPPEEHSFPSALNMTKVQFMSRQGCVTGRCPGWQTSLLEELATWGAQGLVEPQDLYTRCHRGRLTGGMFEEQKQANATYQRRALLDIALERGIISSLVNECVAQWSDGEFAEQGCTLGLLLDWAWDRTVAIKASLNQTCESLYDWSATHLDPRTDRQLQAYSEALGHLKKVFTSLMEHATPTTEQGLLELELRVDVLNLLIQHHDMVRWGLACQLLPEVDELSDHDPDLFAYPITDLGEKYRKKRVSIAGCKGSVPSLSLLLIDNLVECEGPQIKQLWGDQGGTGLYPPPSMQALLYLYLLDGVSLQVKHAVTLYLLRDLASVTSLDVEDILIPSFIQRFMLSPGLVHQVQGMWAIDDGDFEEGMRRLVNPCVQTEVCGSWNGAAVVNTLLALGQSKAASNYLHTRRAWGGSLQEQSLYVSTLLTNKSVSQALQFIRGSKAEETYAELFGHLIHQCQATKILGLLLQLKLESPEEDQLERFLCRSQDCASLEPLLLYYLHHSQFIKAFQLHEDMKVLDRSKPSAGGTEQASTRTKLMQAYLNALPDITKKLLLERQNTSASTLAARRHDISKPTPLSTVVRNSDRQAMSRSNFVWAVTERVNEAEQTLADEGLNNSLNDSFRNKGADATSPQVPFLRTPKAVRHSEQRSFADKVVYPDLRLSPFSGLPVSAAKKKSLLQSLVNSVEVKTNKSLQKLTAECAEVLHTPKKDIKKRVMSPGFTSDLARKTPQSILKVRRLSKVQVPGGSGGRRSGVSYARSRRSSQSQSMTNSPTSENKNTSKPSTSKTPISATPKHLRFSGLSPMPTPSPSNISKELTPPPTTKEFSPTPSRSPTPEEVASAEEQTPTKITESIQEVLQEDIVDATNEPLTIPSTQDQQVAPIEERQEAVSSDSEMEVSTTTGPDDLPSPIGDSPKYNDSFNLLQRPNLQSEWKEEHIDSEITEMVVDDDITFNMHSTRPPGPSTPSMTSSPTEDSRKETTEFEDRVERHISTIVEESYMSVKSDITVFTQEESPGANKTVVSQSQIMSSSVTEREISKVNVSNVSDDKEELQTSRMCLVPEPLLLNTTPSKRPRRADSPPPATPPLSKHAKLLSFKHDDVEDVDEGTNQQKLQESSRFKTPSPQRLSPNRFAEEKRKLVAEEEEMDKPETSRYKTPSPQRLSPKRFAEEKKKLAEEEKIDESARSRFKTPSPQRLSPKRFAEEKKKLAEEVDTDEAQGSRYKTPSPQRLSPKSFAEEKRKLAEERSQEERQEISKSPSPQRGSRKGKRFPQQKKKLFEEFSEEEPELAQPRFRTPSPQILSPEQFESHKRKQMEEDEPSSSVSNNEEKTKDDFEEKAPQAKRSRTEERDVVETRKSKTPEREVSRSPARRSLRMKTPDRIETFKSVAESKILETVEESVVSESFLRRSRRQSKTPERVQRKESLIEKVNANDALKSSIPQEMDTANDSEKIDTRTRRQSKTPDRVREKEMTPTRSSRKTSKLDLVVDSPIIDFQIETPVISLPTPSPSPLPPKVSMKLNLGRKMSKITKETTQTILESETSSQSKGDEEITDALTSQIVQTEDQTARRTRRQSRTPERLGKPKIEKAAEKTETVNDSNIDETLARSAMTRLAKSPARSSVTEPAEAEHSEIIEQDKPSATRRQTRGQSRSPTKPEITSDDESASVRRSRRQSKTPERLKDHVTPPRHSARHAKSPEKLNTPEIQPVMSQSLSKPPASPSRSKTPAKAVKAHTVDTPLTPTRRSKRQPKSPERLNTDEIQPLSPHTSPTRAQPQSQPQEEIKLSTGRATRSASREPNSPDRSVPKKRGRPKKGETPDRDLSSSTPASPSRRGRSTKVSSSNMMQEITEEEGAGQPELSMTIEDQEVVQEDEMPPLRLEMDEESGDTSRLSKSKRGKRKTRKEAVQSGPSDSFIFSPPVSRSSRDAHSSTDQGPSSGQARHQEESTAGFVFSAPDVLAGSPKPQRKTKTDNENDLISRRKSRKKSLWSDEVNLLSPGDSLVPRTRAQSSNQIAMANILKRYQSPVFLGFNKKNLKKAKTTVRLQPRPGSMFGKVTRQRKDPGEESPSDLIGMTVRRNSYKYVWGEEEEKDVKAGKKK